MRYKARHVADGETGVSWPLTSGNKAVTGQLARGGDIRRRLGVEAATRRLLLGGVVPLWLGAGLADWHKHKRTRIETTAGARESAIHALMMCEAGVPVMLGLFCEISPGADPDRCALAWMSRPKEGRETGWRQASGRSEPDGRM